MQYDQLGFPIPAEFDPLVDQDERDGFSRPPRSRAASAGSPQRGKRRFLGLLAGLVIVPLVVGPSLLPVVREGVIEWSLKRAIAHEGRGNVDWAVEDIGRAIDWLGDSTQEPSRKSRLLCWRAMLRIEDSSPDLGLADADQAAVTDPTAVQPQRVRALALCVLGDFEQAIQAAQMAVGLAGDDDPDTLNHRAYIRALAGRDLKAALDDINRALEDSGQGSPEFLDTRGYILHLLGRQQEALDDLNIAIDATQEDRRRLLLLAGHVDEDEFAYRLRAIDHGLAVMLQHRGLACQALGLEAQARQDLALAKNKGFDPSRGVW
jgi:tetratricopeptide (TPR) repeat protein